MDEQTRRIIEAFAKMRATKDDADVIELAQRKVRTTEGVKKYDQPIGTIITKDMIDQAAKKAASAATQSLNSQVAGKQSGSSSSSSSPAPSKAVPKSSVLGSVKQPTQSGVPGGQTTNDIQKFYVSAYINNPSTAPNGWVMKKDGKWYSQKYDGKGGIVSESPMDDAQVNALELMQTKGLLHDAHVPEATDEDQPKIISSQINELLKSGKKTSDPDVSALITKLQGAAAKAKQEKVEPVNSASSSESSAASEVKKAEPKASDGKTVTINGSQVKVGRYSRPKGFAKAFMIVHEDGTVEYENKNGERKKITHSAFKKNQDLGMTKFLTSDTGAIKKGEHFENGKLVDDAGSEPAASSAKVADMNTPQPAAKPAPQASQPAQEQPKPVPGGAALKPEATTKVKFENLDKPAAKPEEKATEDSGTVTVGGLKVKPGRYSRPKGFAKAFLIVHPDGTAEYENKKGERKKLTGAAFKKNWDLGMDKFLTSDTGAIKKGQHFEEGKLVNDDKSEIKTETPEAPKVSPVIQAAQEASAALKAKLDEKKAESVKEEEPKQTLKPGQTLLKAAYNELVVEPEDKVYVVDIYQKSENGSVNVFFIKKADGSWQKLGKLSGHKDTISNLMSSGLDADVADGDLLLWDGHKGKKQEKKFTVHAHGNASDTKEITVDADSKFYVGSLDKEKSVVSAFYEVQPGGDIYFHTKPKSQKLVPTVVSYMKQSILDKEVVEWTPGQKTENKKDVFTVDVKSFSGTTNSYDVPTGTKVYVADVNQSKSDVAWAYFEYPDGTYAKLGAASGYKNADSHAIKSMINAGDLVLWDKHNKAAEPELKETPDFVVKIDGINAANVPGNSKVWTLGGDNPATTSIKYVESPEGEWTSVNSYGQQSVSPGVKTTLDKYKGNGMLKDVTAGDSKNTVSSSAKNDPVQTKAEAAEVSDVVISVPAAMTDPDKTVKISGMNIKPGKYSIGKSFAKAFLLVHSDGTAEYQNKSGAKKKLSAAAFQKNWDSGMSVYAGPLDTPDGVSVAKPTEQNNVSKPVSVLPGDYGYGPVDGDPFDISKPANGVLKVYDDGSAVFVKPNGDKDSFNPSQTVTLFNSGQVLDEFGNSAQIPGMTPAGYRLFGSKKLVTADQLKEIRDTITQGKPMLTLLMAHTGGLNMSSMHAYVQKHNTGGSSAAFVKVIDDMLQAKAATFAQKPAAVEVPNQTKGLFTVDQHGYAIWPGDKSESAAPNYSYMSASEQNQFIKKLAATIGDGKVMGQAPSKLSIYAKSDWIGAFYKGDMQEIYTLEKNSGMKVDETHPGHPNNKDTHKITWQAAIPSELPAGKIPDGEWTLDTYYMTPEEIDNYLIAANMAYPSYLSSYGKKKWVSNHINGNKSYVDKISMEAKSNFDSNPNYQLSTPPKFTPGVKPKKIYEEYVAAGSAVDNWPESAVKQYVIDFPDSVPADQKSKPVWMQSKAVQDYITTKKAEEAAKKHAEYLESLKPKFQKAPGQGVSGGHHEAMVLVDQFGKKWVYKPRSEKDIFLADVEQEAHTLAKLWGYKTSNSFITDFDDRKGHVQEMFDAESDLTGVSMSSLTPSQVTDIAKEHLLDWALDNDDSWGANLLKLKNGSIVGIDKGRAFAAIGHWNGLSADSSAHVHMPLVYTDLYNAIGNKTISQEDANAAYFAVLKQAKKMQALSDSKMTESLEKAFANRTNWSTTGGPANKEEAIKAALDRKNSLVDDMEKLWGNVFKKAGYDKPAAPEGVVSNPEDQDIHLGVTPAALEQAKANKSFGTSVFFGGPEIEDAHMLLYHTKSKAGVDMINGELKIRESSEAFKSVEKWLKDNAVVVDNAYGFTPGSMKQELPNEADYYTKIISAVKTISTHALDGQYNEGHLNGMSWVKNTLKNYVDEYDSKMANPNTQADLVKQYKDPKAFYEMANKYLGFIKDAEDHKANGTKSAPGAFARYEWTPPKEDTPEPVSGLGIKVELLKASSAKSNVTGEPKFEADGSLQHHSGYTTDGNPGSMYLLTMPTGETIEFRGNTTGTPASSKGLTRITFPAGENEAASLARVQAQLADMGLSMKDADEDDLELYYWRHLAGILDARADSKKSAYSKTKSSDKYAKFQQDRPVETAKLSSAEEIEAWRKAFANVTSREQIDEFVAGGGHLPKFGHYMTSDKDAASGQPYWERFDVTDEQAYSKQMMGHSLSDERVAEWLTFTGGGYSTEARLRTLGLWKDGMSSTSDMSHGSSGFFFVRQNQEVKESSSGYSPLYSVYLSPKVLKRTHNYSFSDDKYGEMNYKGEYAFFDFDALTQHDSTGNELMIKHAVSLLDDIEIVTFEDPKMRDRAIKALKDLGIDEIRGVPVEKRFVMRNKSDVLEAQKAVKEAWKK